MSLRTDLLNEAGIVHVLEGRLRSPALWPTAPMLADMALGRGFRAPPREALSPGQASLVAVRREGRIASLWRLDPQCAAKVFAPHASFVGEAARSLELAQRLALRDLPILRDPGALGSGPPWRAEGVVVEKGLYDRALDGSSFGLAMALACASRATGLVVPPDVLATAAVAPTGEVLAVDPELLDDKLRLLAEEALGIERLLVAPTQVERCHRQLEKLPLHGRTVRVLGPRTVGDAFEEVFTELTERVVAMLTRGPGAEATLELLWRTTVRGTTGLLRWQGVAAAAEALQERYRNGGQRDPGRAHRAGVVAQIAWRHCQRSQAALPWPDEASLRALPKPLRGELLAHVVQSAADDGDADALDYAQRAGPWTQPFGECHAEDLKLHGSIVRALAAAGRYPEALTLSARVVREWYVIDEVPQVSYALSELLRLTGLAGDQEALQGLLGDAVAGALGHPELAPLAAAYVRLAAARACVTCGRYSEAERLLAEGGGAELLPAPWMRWRARSLHGLGERDAARALRGELEDDARRDATARYQWLHARLDAAVESGDDDACVSSLKELESDLEARRCISRCPVSRASAGVVAFARWVAEHSRY